MSALAVLDMGRLPSPTAIASAKLPVVYEAAVNALAQCERVDECKDWSDKAAAIASYAKQQKNEAMFNMARRIQLRATERLGVLLQSYKMEPVDSGALKGRAGDHPTFSQRDTARLNGLSDHQLKEAVRVAAVPREQFEAMVESDTPPTISALAEIGKKTKPKPVVPPPPEGFYEATHVMGAARMLDEKIDDHEPEFVAGGILDDEVRRAVEILDRVAPWLLEFRNILKRRR